MSVTSSGISLFIFFALPYFILLIRSCREQVITSAMSGPIPHIISQAWMISTKTRGGPTPSTPTMCAKRYQNQDSMYEQMNTCMYTIHGKVARRMREREKKKGYISYYRMYVYEWR